MISVDSVSVGVVMQNHPGLSTVPRVIPLAEVRTDARRECGPKAANIARMIHLGLPVPPGFCITGTVWREHLCSNGLTCKLEAVLNAHDRSDPEQTRRLLAELRNAIIEAPIPSGIEHKIRTHVQSLGAPLMAVRSSASAEDLPDHSFAGQHDTSLGAADLSGCLHAVKKCWASLWGERAFGYRARIGIPHRSVDMAVIVQRLVPAEASGVIFTAHPLAGRPDRIVIEATLGLGESLVTGTVTPDRFILSKPGLDVISCHTADKTVELVPDPSGGIAERPVGRERAAAPSLSEGTASRLGRLALKVEGEFGCPMDIEFAVSGHDVFLLQARPVTAIPAAAGAPEDRQIWTNVNTGEVMPDVVTPMTWSMAEPLVYLLIGQFARKLGMDIEGHPVIGRIAGRAYFNLNTAIACLRRVPGIGEKGLTKMFGGRQDLAAELNQITIAEEDIPDLRFSRLGVGLRIPGLLFEFLTFSPSDGEAVVERVAQQTEARASVRIEGLSAADLASKAHAIIEGQSGDVEAFDCAGLAVSCGTIFYGGCRKWFGAEGDSLAGRMLMGIGNNRNANAGLELWRLAQLAHEHPAVEAAVLAAAGFPALRAQLTGGRAGRQFLEAWYAFMNVHGHHCRGEIELMNPRWSETPGHILKQLQSYLRVIDENDFLARYDKLAGERKRAIKEALGRLRNPFKRVLFRLLLRKAQLCAPLRENLKCELVRRLAFLRRLLLELGGRLTQTGALSCRDDIFFLRLGELEPVSMGREDVHAVRQRIAERRSEYETNLAITPPPIVAGRFNPEIGWAPTVEKDADTLLGTPISPGVARGPARVILRGGDDQVRPGEILVAPFTDPGWTPYFLNAAAIVMDMGGLLSHGSIIAREYGIPAVVNVGSATNIIRTGQMLEVDAGRGVVKILSPGVAADDGTSL